MEFRPIEIPLKKEENSETDVNSKIIDRLSKFDTDGFDEYPKEKFLKYILENNIDASKALDSYLENINPADKFSDTEFKYIQAFRAWLHSDFDNVKKYINDKFNFECESSEDFIEKYRFFNTVAVFIFENLNIWKETETVKEEKFIFKNLQEQASKNKGSFLLNYLAQDYLSVIDKKKFSIQDESHFELAPFKISPKQYAFDSSLSFAGIYENDFKSHELCVSEDKDFEKVSELVESLGENFLNIGQDKFDELAKYFSILKSNDLMLETQSKNINKLEVFLFKELNNKYHRTNLKEKTGIDFSQLSLIEQRYFINYLKFVDNVSLEKVKNFNEKYNKDGFRTFLSIEQGGNEMGDKILILGEKLPEEAVKILFEKYGEIIDEVDNIAGYLSKSTEGRVLPPEVIKSAKENLLIRGKDLLNSYAIKANVCGGEECVNIGKELEEKLSNIKASLLLFAAACKSLSEEGLLSIEDLANTDLEIVHGSIDEKTQEEMKRIFKENRPNYSKELLDDVTKEFEDALKNSKENQTFYILRNNKDLASFMRLDEQEDGSIYGASFNVRTELRGSSIGTELMKKIVIKESSSRLFKILCYEKNPMLEKYKTEFGFNIVGEIDNYHNTGEKFYKMERSPISNQ